jgi:hypothetical protein
MRKKVLITGIILVPFLGNILWPFTGLGWLYWGSRFLLLTELIVWVYYLYSSQESSRDGQLVHNLPRNRCHENY